MRGKEVWGDSTTRSQHRDEHANQPMQRRWLEATAFFVTANGRRTTSSAPAPPTRSTTMARTTTTADPRHPSTLGAPAELGLEPGDVPPIDLHDLLRGGFVRVDAALPRSPEDTGETPIEG